MENFIKKIILGNGIKPSEECLNTFKSNFKKAVNVEWFDRETYYEAIFYKEKLEHIAIFSKLGELIEYKVNLPTGYLPALIKKHLENKGEIMNVVLRNKGNSIEYEAIIRDADLVRHLILLTNLGKIIDEKQL